MIGAAPSEWAKTSTAGSVAPDPDPVEGFEAEADGPTAIKLSWTAVEDDVNDDNDDIAFEIEHNTVGADETDWLTTGKPPVSSTEHTHSGLDPETEYWYRIRAKPTSETMVLATGPRWFRRRREKIRERRVLSVA